MTKIVPRLIRTLILTLLTSSIPYSHQTIIGAGGAHGLKWGPCMTPPASTRGEPDSLVCANFTVPLDWTNASNGKKAILYVVKLPAASGSSLGTIFTNPGGPGGSGLELLTGEWSPLLSNITGGNFDIVSWDPRGVGLSTPSINCFDDEGDKSADELAQEFTQTLTGSTFNTGTSVVQSDVDRFLATVTDVENYMKAFVQRCLDKNKDNLKYVGTVATVKDLVALVDAIEGPECPIRYWGFSYGTAIGADLLDLYPDRIGRVVLDGILDVNLYTHNPSYLSYDDSIQDADKALQAFYDACAAAGPNSCPISSPGATGATIRQWSNDLIDAAYTGAATNRTPVTPIWIRAQLSEAAGSPDHWKMAANGLKGLYGLVHGGDGSGSTSKRLAMRHFSPLPLKKRQMTSDPYANKVSSPYAIWCGDSADDDTPTTTTEVFNELVRVTKEVSNVEGPMAIFYPAAFCHLWKTRAVERHLSPGAPKLANPVVIIGNTYDVVTPLASARKLAKRLNDVGSRQAALVQHDGTGHLSLEMDSACTYDIIRRYFTEGVVPEDTLCGVNFNGFIGSDKADNHNTSTTTVSAPSSSASGESQTSRNGASALNRSSITLLMLLFLVGIVSDFILFL